MPDVTFATEAKSDQLNAIDIQSADRIILIAAVDVAKRDQPVWVSFAGDNGRPWKPSKGMIRILAAAYGNDSAAWVGQSVQLTFEPEVVYGGKAVGGIRIKAMTGIPQGGLNSILVISRQKRIPYRVEHLDAARPAYPDKKFNKGLPAMIGAMMEGKMGLQEVIAQCQRTGDLSDEQLLTLQEAAPIDEGTADAAAINSHEGDDCESE